MTSASVAVDAPTERNARWLIVALLTIGVIIAYTDRINLSSALPEIRKSFPLSPEASGILLSAFFWSYTLLQMPAGWVVASSWRLLFCPAVITNSWSPASEGVICQ